jgi:hypothetical protein
MPEQTKQQLLEHVRAEQTQWETLLRDIGEERMQLPGVTDEWRVQDVIAHLTTWWRRDVAGLENVRRGEQPEPHPSQQDVQVINDWIYYTNRDRPLAAVLQDAQAVWQHLIELLESFSEAELMARGHFVWLADAALGPSTLDSFLGHFHDEHEESLRTWLANLNTE